ncbi:ATP-binding cassette sub-family A member 13 [Vanessa tameamea]|uniref:ATP-binding cassette sub-family A member 13 n=1 Tax=Vanessa tameamea TaxID=334116 RepID=A0A8B8HZL5_VANTA
MAAGLQLRLLLWKDYLIRKRKPITLAGILWATFVMLSLYIVRINIDNKDYPTCQFAARALPSAGVLNFLQSFVCNVNNECSPLEEFEEIPTYEKSRFTQIQRQLSPLLNNATVVDTASTAPDALKLLATLSDIADNAVFSNITKNGLRVSDLFRNPNRVKRYISRQLDISEEVTDSVMVAEIGFEGIFQEGIDRCNAKSTVKTIKIKNVEHLNIFVNKLCNVENKIIQNLVKDLLLEIDLGKYVTMAGEMYSKLTGDDRITRIGDMLVAVLRMTSISSFLPPELTTILQGRQPDFSYINLTMITKVMDMFQPTFGETDSYKSLRDIIDTVVLGIEYLNKFLTNKGDTVEVTDLELTNVGNVLDINKGIKRFTVIFGNVADVVTELSSNDTDANIFNILSRLTNFVLKWLPANQRHDVLFYSSLLGKLIEGSERVIDINMHLEQLAHNVSLRNPQGVKVLLKLPLHIVKSGLEALADAERTQIATSKMNDPGQMFCDINRLKNFFLISREEASDLKAQLCTDGWKNYIYDLVSSFGIYEVKNNINSMASLFVLETLGKDISDELYTIDKDFEILKNFTENLKRMELEERPAINWSLVLNVSEESELLKVFRNKSHLGKNILITVHGALAKEVVSQNPLLEYKISPFLKNINIMIKAMNEQLDVAPRGLQIKVKELYPEIIRTILTTALDEEKSYKALSTSCQDILCHGSETAKAYLNFPPNITEEILVTTLCNVTIAIEKGLRRDSVIGKAINHITNVKHTTLEEINWTQIITGLNNLYEKLNDDYTYLFEYKTYGMDKGLQKEVTAMMDEVMDFWFNAKNLNRILHLSIKLGLRFLDILDRGIFNITADIWLQLKYSFESAAGPMTVADDIIQLIAGISKNETYSSNIPALTASALQHFLPNLPHMIVDLVDLIKSDVTDVAPIISILNSEPYWPCSDSLSQLLQLSQEAKTALTSLETIMCLNRDIQTEWRTYLAAKNATMFKSQNWNTTEYSDSPFLKFSAAFDNLVKDLDLINDIFVNAFDEFEDDRVTLASALKYSVDAFNNTDRVEILRKFFTKLDTVLNSINTSSVQINVPLNTLWKNYLNCTSKEYIDDDCQMIARAAWKYTLQFLAVAGGNMTDDLLTYFTESNEQNATILQQLGFTRSTGLFVLYDKLPEFIAVLLNSYTDLGFMNQIRRASSTQFWDCDEVLMSLNPGLDSPIDMSIIKQVQPFICPSLLHWLSMPKGDNKLIDVFTKPQYYFFTLEAENLTSTYENAYKKANALGVLLKEVANKNITMVKNIKLSTIRDKLEQAIDRILTYEIKDNDTFYISFNEANKKQLTVIIYLTKVVTIINKVITAVNNFTLSDINNISEEDMKSLQEELPLIQKIFERRPSDTIAFHFDIITDVLWTNDKDYKLADAVKASCERLKTKDNSMNILDEMDRVKGQICAKKYYIFYSALQSIMDDYSENGRKTLLDVFETLKIENENFTDIATFFKERQSLVNVLRKSVKYSHDLGVPIYLKYLQNNLKHHEIVLSFLSGDDWWSELRNLYSGPKSNNFFDIVEKGFEVAEDILTHVDKIHVVRLLRDLNLNSTESFCQLNVSVSEYVPDGGALAALRAQLCGAGATALFAELPPLVFASQGYNNDLKMSKELDYEELYSDIASTESKLELIRNGPLTPMRPPWVTDEKLSSLKNVAMQLLSKESLIKISFGVLSNFVDAGTLFLNNSQCTLCSEFTTWFKQLNLQLYKKQEYDSLLCGIDQMSQEEIHSALKNDFHWDMAISELISTRNYTKYELNKSLNELLEQIKLHLLDDIGAKPTKLSECLAGNITGNAVGHAALFTMVLARTSKLLAAELPHLQDIRGVTELPYFKQLHLNVAHTLNVKDTLKKYLTNRVEFTKTLVKLTNSTKLVKNIEEGEIHLLLAKELQPTNDYLHLQDHSWEDVCVIHHCDEIISIINKHINFTLVAINVPELQTKEFWRFNFISAIIGHVQVLLDHIARVLGVVSGIDIQGVLEGKLESLLDTGMQLMMDETLDSILYSIRGLLEELKPLLKGTSLDFDVNAIADGLKILHNFKNYIIEEDIKVNVSQIFSRPELIESGLNDLGINNTNFWSIAAPRIQAGYIAIKALLVQKQGKYSISDFTCQIDDMSKVLVPGNVDVVTLDDVYAAVVEQFCGLQDDRVKSVLPVLLKNIDFEVIFDKVKSFLLTKLFIASNLTQLEGDTVLSQFGKMAALIPELQTSIGNITESLSNEPLLLRMKKSASVGDMLASSDFLSDAGKMLCGKPFQTDLNRFYKSIVSMEDLASEPDLAQLQALPTDFCRSLYKDIISMEGGKIVWSFVKPLIVGKILYTPSVPAVQRIVEKANSTFAPMVKMVNLVHSFANSFSAVDKLSLHRGGLDALKNLMTVPQYAGIRKSLLGDVQAPNIDINGIFDDFGDTKALGSILKKASDLLHCVNLNRFKPMPTEHELTQEAARLTLVNEFSAGLVFMNMSDTESAIPSNIEYKIRMDIENAPPTNRLKNYLWIPGPEASFLENMRYFRGFAQIQDIIDKAIIDLSMDNSRKVKKREISDDKTDWAVYTQQMPYPCYRRDFFQTSLYESQSLLVAFFFSLLFTVSSIVRFNVSDKETGNTMLMSVMGVNLSYHTLSWFLWSYIETVVTICCITAVLTVGQILPRTDPSLIFALLLVFGFSVIAFCYMMSTLFRSASVAAVCSGIAYLITFMPFVLILSLEAVLSSSLKLFVSLSMSSSLCYAFLFITRFEAMGVGAGWAQLWEAPDNSSDMNIGIAGIMVFVDGLIYIAVGFVINIFFGIKSTNNVTTCEAKGEKAGVSIINVTKIYNEGSRNAKLALNNVSMELQKGQITTLLGHNGAGKTTLINILTGMQRASRGHVLLRADAARARLGVCPQRDVLLEHMTAREHVALYAQLKAGRRSVQPDVDGMLRVLCLGDVCDVPVARLSGGTRRRLCVALAFVAQPSLVSLDEPTSGVDPAARRDIWSMIMRLRENRTILLTTHHLDEAELLSDQIIIMHKGQIHTTGSPIEIKRTLGTGYNLSVMYPDNKLNSIQYTEPEEVSIEEKTKDLLTVTRSVIKNANLVDVNGLEVEINLPFYDSDGVSNNFLEACSALEQAREALGYRSLALDCSSLEHVFYNICRRADSPDCEMSSVPESSSNSASTSSIKNDQTPLVPPEGPLKGTAWQQFVAILYARYLHYIRNRMLLFLLIVLPSLFIIIAMAFSTIRPPADNEISLKLYRDTYEGSTQFLIPQPPIYSDFIDPSLAQRVMNALQREKQSRNWTNYDSPACKCVDAVQRCDQNKDIDLDRPQMMLLPDVITLNDWLVTSHEVYIEKRYGGFTSSIKNNKTHLVAWYNNKGHHALPSVINELNSALLKLATGDESANITVHTHPLKISKEQLNKDTVYQHIADAGISGMLLLAYSLAGAGGAVYLVSARRDGRAGLARLCGAAPARALLAALLWDFAIIVINMVITAVVLQIFHFPVFVARNNLPAICILILLYGYACTNFVHVFQRLFNEASLANMVMFCGNAFVGLVGIALLLILDIISDSDATDHARWVLHKILMLSPQFTLGDGLLEIAKNSIQAQVLLQFGMDTYRDPFTHNVVGYHYIALVLVGTALFILNLAIEYDYFDVIIVRLRSKSSHTEDSLWPQPIPDEVLAEEQRVTDALQSLRLRTIGNINAGYVDTEDSVSPKKARPTPRAPHDVCATRRLRRQYGARVALHALSLGIPAGQCTALLGENGAGKSTTFSMLTGEIRPTSGHIYLLGRKVNKRDLSQGLISYCPQSDAIDPLMTVKETLVFYCILRGIEGREEVIRRTIELFELTRYTHVRSGALSGGNKRKLCTAVAFMARTPLVLLDEPTSGMDPVSRGCVCAAWRGAARAGRAALLATHALDDARRLAARVALLRAGRLQALASLDDCLRRFGGGYVVACVVRRGAAGAVWACVAQRAPHAALRVLHHAALHFLLPAQSTVDGKEVETKLSDVFRLLAELQMSCDIEDYTVNQSSLDQMFLSFSEKTSILDSIDDPLPTPRLLRRVSEELDTVTSL